MFLRWASAPSRNGGSDGQTEPPAQSIMARRHPPGSPQGRTAMHRRVFAAGLIGLSSAISALGHSPRPPRPLVRGARSCANTGHTDEKPIAITASAIEMFASHCRVLSVTRQGTARSATWRIRTSCVRGPEGTSCAPVSPSCWGRRRQARDARSTGVQKDTRCKRWPSSQGNSPTPDSALIPPPSRFDHAIGKLGPHES